ncbi:MAG: sulfotransferase domain-containing protein [Proteobacteria bacterium]|nr:sulfotransferase domain-containing protein [Pseudomonadota bacterium]
MPRKSIAWLASYPKSGNTWLRIFLANYLFGRTTPMPINQVHRLGMGDSIEKMYRIVARGSRGGSRGGPGGGNFDIADYRQSLALRPGVLGGIVNNDADVNFVKTHNHRAKAFGVGLIPPALTRSAIYILRNPLDMVLSYARQYGHTVEFAAAAIGRADNSIAGADGTVTQYLGSWSGHVKSWARCREFPVLVLRYEDMQTDPGAAFSRALEHIGVPPDPERVARAVRFSAFDELRKQEDAAGFVERSPHAGRFFHSGSAGHWRDELAPEAVARIRKDHGEVMREFGYLDG